MPPTPIPSIHPPAKRNARPFAQDAKRIRRPNIAAAHCAQIDAFRSARQISGGNRSQKIRHNCGNDVGQNHGRGFMD